MTNNVLQVQRTMVLQLQKALTHEEKYVTSKQQFDSSDSFLMKFSFYQTNDLNYETGSVTLHVETSP